MSAAELPAFVSSEEVLSAGAALCEEASAAASFCADVSAAVSFCAGVSAGSVPAALLPAESVLCVPALSADALLEEAARFSEVEAASFVSFS